MLIFDRLLLTTIIHACSKFHKDWTTFEASRVVTVDGQTDGWHYC